MIINNAVVIIIRTLPTIYSFQWCYIHPSHAFLHPKAVGFSCGELPPSQVLCWESMMSVVGAPSSSARRTVMLIISSSSLSGPLGTTIACSLSCITLCFYSSGCKSTLQSNLLHTERLTCQVLFFMLFVTPASGFAQFPGLHSFNWPLLVFFTVLGSLRIHFLIVSCFYPTALHPMSPLLRPLLLYHACIPLCYTITVGWQIFPSSEHNYLLLLSVKIMIIPYNYSNTN